MAKYSLGMEIARSNKGISVSQRKYILVLLAKISISGCKSSDTPIATNTRIENKGGIVDRDRYHRLVGKMIYLSRTRPNIAFAVSKVSQHGHSPKTAHQEAVFKILRYLKGSPGIGLYFKKNDNREVEVFTEID